MFLMTDGMVNLTFKGLTMPNKHRYLRLILGVLVIFGVIIPMESEAQITSKIYKEGRNPSMSADGRFITFDQGVNFPNNRIYIHDRQEGSGNHITDVAGGSDPIISADGNFVAYISNGRGLVVHNRLTHEDHIILDESSSLRVDETQTGRALHDISGDGRYIVFTELFSDIYVHDRQTGSTIKVSVDSNGVEASDRSFYPSISRDGRYVAFISDAENLVNDDTNGVSDVFVHDRQTGETTRVSLTLTGTQRTFASFNSVISGNGQYVAYETFDGISNGIYIYDLQTGLTTTIPSARPNPDNPTSAFPVLSNDGRYIVFEYSDFSNPFSADIFVFDRQTERMTWVSQSFDGKPHNEEGVVRDFNASISDNGRFVVFESDASNLVQDDIDDNTDVFLRDLGSETGTIVNSTELHLTSLGVTVQQARDFIFQHANEPEIIFNAALENNITTLMLSDIVGFSVSDISKYFSTFGLNTLELDN